MDTKNGLNRPTTYALLSALAAGIVSFIMIATFLNMMSWLFLPAVMVMVFVSAYFAFRRQMRDTGTLTGKKIFTLALEVGTLTHFYTFALYFPLYYFFVDFSEFRAEALGSWIGLTLFVGVISLLMFVWIAVPMYLGIGYLQKYFEKNVEFNEHAIDDSLLDDDLSQSEMKPVSMMELD